MDRRSVTRLPRAFSALVLLSCALLVASGQESHPNECEPEQMSLCYGEYHIILWRLKGQTDGGVSNEDISEQCSKLKAKVECHQRIARCPEEARKKFSRQERGYEALRDLFCDANAARDYFTAASCQAGEKFIPCNEKHMEGVTPENTKDPTCKLAEAAIQCYETAFTPACKLPLKSAKAALLKGEEAVMSLAGCDRSAAPFLAPGKLLVAAGALVLLRWASVSWF